MAALSQSPFPGSFPALAAERAAAFASAARDSRRVRRLRYLLPLAGIGLALALVAATALSRIEIALSIGDLKISAAGLTMDAPRLSGSDGKGRTYLVTAGNAVQSLTDTRVIRLSDIAAHVTQADGSSADFSASSGIYDSGTQKLTLEKDIRINASDGSAASLRQAVIDLGNGAVQSDGPVAFSSSLGQIEAKGMGVSRKAGSVTFGGGVKMTVDPKAVQSPNPLKDGLNHPDRKP